MTSLQKDLVIGYSAIHLLSGTCQPGSQSVAGPDVSQADFMKACAEAARDARDAEIAKKTGQLTVSSRHFRQT